MVYYQAFVQEGPPGAKGRKEGATNYELIEYTHDIFLSTSGKPAHCGSSQHQHWFPRAQQQMPSWVLAAKSCGALSLAASAANFAQRCRSEAPVGKCPHLISCTLQSLVSVTFSLTPSVLSSFLSYLSEECRQHPYWRTQFSLNVLKWSQLGCPIWAVSPTSEDIHLNIFAWASFRWLSKLKSIQTPQQYAMTTLRPSLPSAKALKVTTAPLLLVCAAMSAVLSSLPRPSTPSASTSSSAAPASISVVVPLEALCVVARLGRLRVVHLRSNLIALSSSNSNGCLILVPTLPSPEHSTL